MIYLKKMKSKITTDIKRGAKMYEEFRKWLKININKNCNSNLAYEKCKEHIRTLNVNHEEYETLIDIAVEWIDF